MNIKALIKKKIEKKIRKFFPIIPEYSQPARFNYYKALGIKFEKVLDIGAYLGTWKDMFQKIFPGADILMIEANKEKEEILKKKGKYFIAVLGPEDEKVVDYYRCENEDISSGNGIFKENTKYKFEPEKRKTIKLTTLLKDQSGFDLIKIDTQGSELGILQGSTEIIEKTKFLLLELSVVEYNFKAPGYLQVIKYLEENNFKLIDIFDLHYSNGSLIQIDGFFANNRFKEMTDLIGSAHKK
jgi:FkbM family methyltransferase